MLKQCNPTTALSYLAFLFQIADLGTRAQPRTRAESELADYTIHSDREMAVWTQVQTLYTDSYQRRSPGPEA